VIVTVSEPVGAAFTCARAETLGASNVRVCALVPATAATKEVGTPVGNELPFQPGPATLGNVLRGVPQLTDVDVVHVVVPHASVTITTVPVKSRPPKFRPVTVTVAPPDGGEFSSAPYVIAAESKENAKAGCDEVIWVPTIAETVTMACRLRREAGGPPYVLGGAQLSNVSDVHDTVAHMS